MNNKAVNSILLFTLSGLILSACSNHDADVQTQSPQSESTTESLLKQKSVSETRVVATDPQEESLVQADSKIEDKSVAKGGDKSALGAKQAETFRAIYVSTCMQYLLKLDELRNSLSALPKFPTEQASQLLAGNAGSAWPVPADTGSYILAMPDDSNLCAIYAKNLNIQLTNQQFTEIYSKPPSPFTATQMDNTIEQKEGGNKTSLSYSWSAPDTPRKMLFMLTTDESATKDVKAMYTASITSE